MLRKSHSPGFKAKVALEAIRESRTTAELSSVYGVHSTMISRWKRHVLEQLPELFSGKIREKDRKTDALLASLYQQIGQLKVELDWLKKKSNELK